MNFNSLPFDLQSYKVAYDNNPQAFCIIFVSKNNGEYEDITFIYANKAYELMSGFSLDKLIGHSYTEIIGVPGKQWNNIYGETAYNAVSQTLTVPGSEIGAVVSIQCFQVAPGFCGSNVLDVTSEFKMAEKAMEESRVNLEKIITERTMYQTLLDQSSAMITVIDAESFEIMYANEAAQNATKGIEGGYVGTVCYRSIARADMPCKDCLLNRAGAPEEEVKEIPYGKRIYRMVYKHIDWNGRKALMEYSEDITEQKQILKLAETNVRLHENIIANLPTGIIVYKIENHNYTTVQVNPAVCRMMGIDKSDAVGKVGNEILGLVLPEYRRLVSEAAVKMAVSGVDVHYEFQSHIKNSEKIIWVAAEGRSAVQPDGSVYVYIGYKDITDSKEKELEFRQQVDFISNLNDAAIISKGRHNISKNMVLVLEAFKPGAVSMEYGKSYDILLEVLKNTAINPQDREKLGAMLNRENLMNLFSQGKREHSIDYRREMGDGSRIWATIKCSLYEDPGSHDIIAFLYSYDNTEQIQEIQIVNRISTLEYGLLALIDVRTRNYKTVYRIDASREQLSGMRGNYDEMISNRMMLPAVLGNKAAILKDMLFEKVIAELEKRRIYTVDYSAKNPDGSLRRMRFHYSYLDDSREMILFFSSDITESFMKEQEQIQSVEEALHEAQEANRAKSVFFSRMSHDMRTPMNGIMGVTALSEKETDVSVLQRNISKIHESGEYLLSLINDTLDVQRIESGRMKLEPQIVCTTEIINNIMDMVNTTAQAKGVSVRFNPGNTDFTWFVWADPVRIKQIFVNLLSNAVKFTPAGGTVEFSANRVSLDGMISHDVFTVTDTGIGMSREFIENRIFQPFSQESNAVTANYAGSGLGLSIAKSLVELMGGTIEVESELGVGTTFTIHLNFERVDRDKAEELHMMQKKRTKDITTALWGKKILLAEDHPLNAEITEKLLEKVGCKVVWMQNGQTALERFEKSAPGEFDAILMDIRMPVMDGLSSAKAIRTLPRPDSAEIPIIAMTANAYDEDVKKSLAVGMNAHLGKPFDPGTMYETIAGFIASK